MPRREIPSEELEFVPKPRLNSAENYVIYSSVPVSCLYCLLGTRAHVCSVCALQSKSMKSVPLIEKLFSVLDTILDTVSRWDTLRNVEKERQRCFEELIANQSALSDVCLLCAVET